MGQNLKYFSLLCFLIILYVVGLLIFAKGFLLKRVVVERNSSCKVDFAMQSDMHGEKGCWMHVRYKKAVIIVIDALRYDFVAFDSSEDSSLHYKNKFTVIQNHLRKPNNAKLYKFIADPPTTTLQRLKGLTTGSLPTFVDAGSNFASSEIKEDNFIDQFISHQKRIKFLGDDTWIGLFPNRFQKQFPFPSFNVKDLHTVDDGVLRHLYTEMGKSDWDVIVAHFLGVDHCGHRYGPNHPAMSEKLSQMNDMLRNVTKLISDDTILFVMGDHGMTRTGDHGGDSQEELEAALFVYSPAQITSQHNLWKERDTVSQIDFVPTISLLMGIPIPFSNLGQVIEELFTHCPWWQTTSDIKKVYHSTKALRLNAKQISYYLQAYYDYSSDFPIQKYYELQYLLDHAEKDLQALVTSMVKDGTSKDVTEDLKILRQHYFDYISEVGRICKGIWAKFDMMSISIGILTLLLAVTINIYYVQISNINVVPNTLIILYLYCFVYIAYAVFQTFIVGESLTAFMVYILAIIGIVMVMILTWNLQKPDTVTTTTWTMDIGNMFSWMIMLLYFVSFFSNSFVVYEDSTTLFFSQTLSWMYCFKCIQSILVKYDTSQSDQKQKRHKVQHKTYDIMRTLTQPSILAIFVTMLLNIFLRISTNFRACREEQWTCSVSLFLYPLTSLPEELIGYRNVRYFFSVTCVLFFLLAIRKYLRHSGNLHGNSPGIICVKYLYPICGVAIVLYWALQGLPQQILDSLPTWQQVFLPRLVYIILFISFIVTMWKPLIIHLLPKQEKYSVQKDGTIIPQMFNKMKQNFQDETEKEHPPIVFGLGTTYSSALINFVVLVYLLLILLLGDGPSPSLLAAFMTVWLFLELYTASGTFTKMVFSGDESSGYGLTKACYIDFWLDTIHCYATTESPDQSVDEPTLDKLEPPIIIVCTGTDKVEGELSEQKSLFVRDLNSILKRQSKRKHIRNIQYLSNKEPLQKDLLKLQSAIFKTATEMSSWGKELPLRWIHLETTLDGERDAGSNILPFHLVVKLAKDSSLPTSDNEEIILFLRYQHECGHVIFFKDLPDYIILNPRWLIDAFKCLVSAHQFQETLLHLDDWIELEETGRLTNKLISKLFEKVPNLKFMEYKDHLLHVLEKFDIIVKPNNINNENRTSYYMPCMVKPSSFNVICDKFDVHTPSCHRTSWLLLEFEFLPPAFFNHVLVGYIRKFNVSIESTENGSRLSLYRGIGVFDIDKSGCRKLVICADKNLIAFQIWIYGNALHSTFHDFRHTLTNMVDMLSERYQICCKYKVKLKCSESDYQKAEGRFECKDLQDDKIYLCPEHHREHEYLDVYKDWFSDKGDVDDLFKEEEQDVKTATIEFLKIELEKDGILFRGSVADDGNSFFKACSDQLQRLEIPGHTHTELRQMVIPSLKLCSENEIKSANFTSDTWKRYIDKVAKDKENVEDIVVEHMAKLLRRQIIVYSRSYTNEISRKNFIKDAKGTPFLLAKDKLYYQSLDRRHGTPSRRQESNTSKRAAGSTTLLDDNASPFKRPRATQEDYIFGIPTSSSLQGTSYEKNSEEADVSQVESEKGPENKNIKKVNKDEKMLILTSYISLRIKSDWDNLTENVYKKRNQALSREMIKHYEDLYKRNKLTNRIKGYIQRVHSGRAKETDPEIIALI